MRAPDDAYRPYAIKEDDPALVILQASEIGRALLALNDGKYQKIYRMDLHALAAIDPHMALASWNVAASYNTRTDQIILFDHWRAPTPVECAYNLAHEMTHRFQMRHEAPLKLRNAHEYAGRSIMHEVHANTMAGIVLMQALETFETDGYHFDYVQDIRKCLEMRSLAPIFDGHRQQKEKSLTALAQESFSQTYKATFSRMQPYVEQSLSISQIEQIKRDVYQILGFVSGSCVLAFSAASAYVHDTKTLAAGLGGVAAGLLGIGFYARKQYRSYGTQDTTLRLAHIIDISASNKIPLQGDAQGYEVFELDETQYEIWREDILQKTTNIATIQPACD